jgi:hypothetical protein
VFVHFKTPFAARTPARFDIILEDGTVLHPNVRLSRCTKDDLMRIWGYIIKTGNPILGPWTGPADK